MSSSPVKLLSPRQESTPPDKDFIASELGENYLFPSLGNEPEVRKETLTPGPIYYPNETLSRRTPGIDRPPTNISIFNSFRGFGSPTFLGESNSDNYSRFFGSDDDFFNTNSSLGSLLNNSILQSPPPPPSSTSSSSHNILETTELQNDKELLNYVSPGKNVNCPPFFPKDSSLPISVSASVSTSTSSSLSSISSSSSTITSIIHTHSNISSQHHNHNNNHHHNQHLEEDHLDWNERGHEVVLPPLHPLRGGAGIYYQNYGDIDNLEPEFYRHFTNNIINNNTNVNNNNNNNNNNLESRGGVPLNRTLPLDSIPGNFESKPRLPVQSQRYINQNDNNIITNNIPNNNNNQLHYYQNQNSHQESENKKYPQKSHNQSNHNMLYELSHHPNRQQKELQTNQQFRSKINTNVSVPNLPLSSMTITPIMNNTTSNITQSSSSSQESSNKNELNESLHDRKRPVSPKSRNELVESPVSKLLYKNFLKVFKTLEGESFPSAISFAIGEVSNLPDKVRWRALIDLADSLKRNSNYSMAREFYRKVCEQYPQINQGWMEWSKMEEECGNLEDSLLILRIAARANSSNELLLTKAIKQHERLNNLSGAREMLGILNEEAIDSTWRTVLEGSLLESRAGNIEMARKLLTALMNKVPWYGPIYHEAFRLEEKAENFDRALAVVQKGLHELPRYGPLWFGLIRIMERKDIMDEANNWTTGEVEPLLIRTRRESQRAICSISRELVWKIHFEQAQIEERAMEIVTLGQHLSTGKLLTECRNKLSGPARKCYTQSLMATPSNLRWKVYLAGARLELFAGQITTAHTLLRQAKLEVPEKSKYHIYLECSRLEEFLGNINSARKILLVARREIKNEWKLYLEAVLVEARANNIIGAIYLADKALSMDSGSGRLWALLVQLVHKCEWKNKFIDIEKTNNKISCNNSKENNDIIDCPDIIPPPDYKIPSKYTILCRALCVVPKSGEVWCEGARTLLNPLSLKYFDLGKAQKYLSFSIQFTPQYGDSFIEYVRLEMLMQVFLPRVLYLLKVPLDYFFSLLGDLDMESDTFKCFKNFNQMMEHAYKGVGKPQYTSKYQSFEQIKQSYLDIGQCKNALQNVYLENLTRRCTNADPNYGTVWFYCRTRPYDTSRAVIRSAFHILIHELIATQTIYVHAIIEYIYRVLNNQFKQSQSKIQEEHPEARCDHFNFDLENWINDFNYFFSINNHDSNNITNSANNHNKGVNGNNETLNKKYKVKDDLKVIPPVIVCEKQTGSLFSCEDFITALIKLNRIMYTEKNTLEEKRKILFGVDQILP